MKAFSILTGLTLGALLFGCAKKPDRPGEDVRRVFESAERGGPLRVVLLGGSITQGGRGWIGDWLQRTFPRSAILLQNSGLGGTGSDVGNFRLDSDVIAYDPQLVLIESCVNDAARPDEDVLRDLESLVRRLRALPRPPAIVLLIAGQERGLDKSRHQKIADHYGLLTIDLDEALHREVEGASLRWADFMVDAVHPNERGNQFYAEAIARELEAVRAGGARGNIRRPTANVSRKPPWTEARFVALRGAPGWPGEDVPAGARYRVFSGLIGADKPGLTLDFSFSGTAVGLLFPTAPTFGGFYATVDDRAPALIRQNTHAGYAFRLIADDLSAGEHMLRITIAEPEPWNRAFPTAGPVKFGFVAVAGEAAASGDSGAPAVSPGVPRFAPISNSHLAWVGPYGDGKPRYRARMDRVCGPEPGGETVFASSWKKVAGEDGGQADLGGTMLADGRAGVFFVKAQILRDQAEEALLRSTITGARKIWVNGEPVSILPREAESDQPCIVPISLKAGKNEVLWKIGSLNGEARFAAAVSVPKGRDLSSSTGH